jgi:hypothetical protein
MWNHECPEEGFIATGKGEACSWCGAVEKRLTRFGTEWVIGKCPEFVVDRHFRRDDV